MQYDEFQEYQFWVMMIDAWTRAEELGEPNEDE